jgi:hypothetical protein
LIENPIIFDLVLTLQVDGLLHFYNIVGTVQNVDDYVEIYAQGDDADIERFIQGVIFLYLAFYIDRKSDNF